MSTSWFKFKYTNAKGFSTNDIIKAKNIRLAKKYILSKNYKLISIRKLYFFEKAYINIKDSTLSKILFRPKLTRNEVYWLTKELYSFLRSGIPLLNALIALKEFSSSKRYHKVLDSIMDNIRHGKLLSSCLSDFPTSFPKYYVIAIQSGESVGHLATSLKSNYEILDWVNKNKIKLIQATIFPILSIVLIIGSFVISLRVLVPYFMEVLKKMNAEVPYITEKMYELNEFLTYYGKEILFGTNFILVFIVVMASNKYTGYYVERAIVKVPVYGELYIYFMSTYLAQTMTLLINQRFSILKSFKLCKDMFKGPFYNKEMDLIYKKIKLGYSLGQCFEESKLFPTFMGQLIKDGERTGTLDTKMEALADLYKARLENKVEWIFKMIPPTYLIFTLLSSIFFMYVFFWPVWKLYL